MLVVLLIRSLEDPMPRGTLEITLPVLPENEAAVVAALARFGWDGRVWPTEEGWPTGTQEESNIRELMRQAKLKATLTFPSDDSGAMAQQVTVSRAAGPFLMPPLPQPEGEVDAAKLERLRGLCADPSTMLLSKPIS
jgi:hypothetical protein